jgi:hypothetical protein
VGDRGLRAGRRAMVGCELLDDTAVCGDIAMILTAGFAGAGASWALGFG